MNKRYQVFVSSTYADLKEERAKVIQTIMELDCIPAGMEIFPAIDEEQFEFIKKVIDDCDYYILIIGGRYGSLSEDGISYTEKEYDYAISIGLKVLAFIHADPEQIPIGRSEIDAELRAKLIAFRDKVSKNRLIKFWNDDKELAGLVALSLSRTIKTYPATGWIRSNTSADPEVYSEVNKLRIINQTIQGQLNALTKEQEIEDLADLNDEILLKGTHTAWNDAFGRDDNSKWSVKLKWHQIFGLISPYLLDIPTDTMVKSILSNVIYDVASNGEPDDSARLNDQNFQTIKIQLKALGLIEIVYSDTTDGGANLFWKLTSKGDKLMMKIRSVKK